MRPTFTRLGFTLLLLAFSTATHAELSASVAGCGTVVSLETHDHSNTRYTLAPVQGDPAQAIVLVLLPGGGGHVNLDEQGCARALKGNSLVRSLPLFHEAGFTTALVDAPSDHPGDDGLAGFRINSQHANDIGKLIADLRLRTHAKIWLIGTSRGSISAANAAARLAGSAAPDGLVLTSVLMVGHSGGQKPWVAQTVFDVPLESIKIPVLLVGHAEDKCLRSPADRMSAVAAKMNSARLQLVTVSGGPGKAGMSSIYACEGHSPHGFEAQEAEVAAGIARFVRGGSY